MAETDDTKSDAFDAESERIYKAIVDLTNGRDFAATCQGIATFLGVAWAQIGNHTSAASIDDLFDQLKRPARDAHSQVVQKMGRQ